GPQRRHRRGEEVPVRRSGVLHRRHLRRPPGSVVRQGWDDQEGSRRSDPARSAPPEPRRARLRALGVRRQLRWSRSELLAQPGRRDRPQHCSWPVGEGDGDFDKMMPLLYKLGWGVIWRYPNHYNHAHLDLGNRSLGNFNRNPNTSGDLWEKLLKMK